MVFKQIWIFGQVLLTLNLFVSVIDIHVLYKMDPVTKMACFLSKVTYCDQKSL